MSVKHNMIKKPELLAPAGDMERLKAAVRFGADAVYLAGLQFGMRTASSNFAPDQMCEAIDFAHKNGVRVYVTANTVPHDSEFKFLPDFLKETAAAGADAFIVSDMGVFNVLRNIVPDAEIHISTQAGITNSESAKFFYNNGAKRIVPARELTLEELGELRKNIPEDMEIEAFVHGAMCMSFSGRCLISSYLTGRDANRGDCAQPCRWKYALAEEKRPGEYFPIDEDSTGSYILNSRDMCMIEHLPELLAAGVHSLKIEGRAKSAYYVALITNAYRRALDAVLEGRDPEPWVFDEVNKISHREYSTGFFFGHEPGQVYANGGYVRDYEVVGVVQSYDGNNLIVSQRNKFSKDETVEILPVDGKPFEICISNMYNENDEEILSAPHAAMTVKIPCNHQVGEGSLIRRQRK